jgi:Zn-dependent peptidase ImmA (M78 family)/transcriptional regulator with XRE-family HTH domain
MRTGVPGFQPDRLAEARDSRGLSQVALGDLIGRDGSTVSRWERGGQLPEPEALHSLSEALRLPVPYFLKPLADHGDRPMFFRALLSTTTQGDRKRAKVRLRWAQDIAMALQEWLDLPSVDLPGLEATDHRQIRDEDIEAIAGESRRRWGLGAGPVSDVMLAVENAGVIVVREEVGTASMDGVSNWSELDKRPGILIASDKATAVRSRMDLAHELGHLVLHRHIPERTLHSSADFKEIERQAFHFAGALLLPAESFSAEVYSPSLNTFHMLKERWKVSIGAMVKRSAQLGMVSSEYEARLWKHYSARGWRKSEPLDDKFKAEVPRLLARSVRLLIDEGVQSREDLLAELRLTATDIESLCALPRGYLNLASAEVVPFPSLKARQPIASGKTDSSERDTD